MFCPSCGVAVQPDQRFCNACGSALTTVPVSPGPSFPPPTEPAPTNAVAEQIIAVPPGQIPPPAPATATAQYPAVGTPEFDEVFGTARFGVVEQTTHTQEQLAKSAWAADDSEATTDAVPRITAEAVYLPVAGNDVLGTPVRVATMVLALATATVAVLSVLLTVVAYRVSGDVVADVQVRMNDLSSNALVGAVIAAALLLIGGGLAMGGQRFGVGLAGGAGLALAGTMAWLTGEAVSVLDTLRQGFAESTMTYTLSTTMDVGLWLAVAATVLGGILFFVSLVGVRGDHTPSVHPAVGALGMLGALAVAVGPMLPKGDARFADNFTPDHAVGPSRFWKSLLDLTLGITHEPVPPITTWMRVLVLLLLLMGGFVGFLAGTRWGMGLVLGAVSIAVWQWVTSLLEAGDLPFGIAGGNHGTERFEPHVVTTVGVIVVLVAVVVGTVLAYLPRRNPAATS
ncbi:MAG: zinc ribbon domain-containing protein [Ilumatobacteraceae bacterium]